jgi:hypothetical protein
MFKKLFRKKPQQDYQFIVHHTRSTDRVFFGPFKNYKELDTFFEDPKNRSIQHGVEILISPTCPQDRYWWSPLEYLAEHHDYLFERDEKHAEIQS